MKSDHDSRTKRAPLAMAARIAVAMICSARIAASQPIAETARTPAPHSALRSPPPSDGPLEIHASFLLLSINKIGDEAENIAFSGVLTLVWKDERQAFDPATEGASEKVFSGAYQFNELSPSWYPQVTLANAGGQYDSRATLLRVKPDGTSTLSEHIDAIAKVNLNMWRFPFDRQQLEFIFRAFGFDAHEVTFHTSQDSASADSSLTKVPQWKLESIAASTRTLNAENSNTTRAASAFVVTVDVKRQPLFMLRLVVLPLSLIVILSWSVFWMDRSSVGDRMSVSFVGILTAVAYQITLGGIVPNVSEFTYMNGFLNLSLMLMCATVVINLYVGAVDKRGHHQRGDRIDRRCRWIFPLAYLGLNALALAVAFLLN